MISQIYINPAVLDNIKELRTEYLRSLPVFQELYLELMVANAQCFLLVMNDESVGYILHNKEGILVELYLKDKYLPAFEENFCNIIKELSVKKILCKSFDYLLLNACITKHWPYKIIGAHYREIVERTGPASSNLTYRIAVEDDIPFLLKQEDGLYETPDELEMFVKGRNVTMFFDNEQFIGCGYYIKVHPDWNYIDIGMWVYPAYRRKGYATQIISILKDNCFRNKEHPICGCDINNLASRKTLEKCGFISKYKLMEFTVE